MHGTSVVHAIDDVMRFQVLYWSNCAAESIASLHHRGRIDQVRCVWGSTAIF